MIKQIEAELFLKADLTVGYVNGAWHKTAGL